MAAALSEAPFFKPSACSSSTILHPDARPMFLPIKSTSFISLARPLRCAKVEDASFSIPAEEKADEVEDEDGVLGSSIVSSPSPSSSTRDRRRVVKLAWEKLVRWSRSWRSKAKTDVLERTNKVSSFLTCYFLDVYLCSNVVGVGFLFLF